MVEYTIEKQIYYYPPKRGFIDMEYGNVDNPGPFYSKEDAIRKAERMGNCINKNEALIVVEEDTIKDTRVIVYIYSKKRGGKRID